MAPAVATLHQYTPAVGVALAPDAAGGRAATRPGHTEQRVRRARPHVAGRRGDDVRRAQRMSHFLFNSAATPHF